MLQFEEQVTPQNAVAMLRRGSVPVNVDVIKVDIDSCDCQVADSVLHAYHPKVFLLEINPCFPPPVRFQQRFSSTYKWDGRFSDITSGCSLSQASEMMAAHGYTLLQVDYINACYVANEFADAFAGVLPATTLAAFHSGFSLRQGIGRYTWLPHIAPCLGQIQHSVNTFLAKPDAMPSADDESSEALLELTRASLAATARPAEAGAAPPFMLWA